MDPKVARKINQQFSSYPQRTYPKGQMLLFPGDEPGFLFYVVEGKIRKYDISSKGDEVVVNIFKPPVPLPMTPLLRKTPNRYFYKTETAVTMHLVPRQEALNFFEANSDVLCGLLAWLYLLIEGFQGRIVQLMSGNAKSRVAYELIDECRRFGQKQPDGCKLSVTETDLAARSGLSRETVSREINKLKATGLITIKNRDIFITKLAGLKKLL